MAKDSQEQGTAKSEKGFSKFVNSVSTLATSGVDKISGITKKKASNIIKVKEECEVLDSATSVRNWLINVRSEVSPALAETIHGQLYVLSYVQSPDMSGMAVDNLIFCLDKSLKQASDDAEKLFIRETFCSMVQNLMFISDARLAYAIYKNEEEAGAILTQAGDILDSTISAIISTVFHSRNDAPIITNIFAEKEARNGFFKKLNSWVSQKKEIEDKKADYYASVVNMFKTFDRYSELIGPSIIIFGMLDRYRPMVMEYYREQWGKELKKKSGISKENISILIEASTQLLGSILNRKKLGDNIKKAGQTLSKLQSAEPSSYEELQDAENKTVAELAMAKKKEEDLQKEHKEVLVELNHTSSLQLSRRKKLRDKLDTLGKRLSKATEHCKEVEYRLVKYRELIKQQEPILEEFKSIDEELQRISEKYYIG